MSVMNTADAHLLHFRKYVLVCGQLAIQAEKLLFLLGQLLNDGRKERSISSTSPHTQQMKRSSQRKKDYTQPTHCDGATKLTLISIFLSFAGSMVAGSYG